MTKLFRRVTNIFKRNPSPRQTSTKPTSNPYDRRNPNPNRVAQTKDDDNDDDDDDDDYDERPIRDEYASTPLDIKPQRTTPRSPNPVNTLPTPLPQVNNNGIPQHTPQPPVEALRPKRTPNQSSIPTVSRMPTAPVRRNLQPLFDRPHRPLRISPNSTLISFPSHAIQHDISTFRQGPHSQFVNYEYDYPIENVVIDGNIPSSMAMKINRAVERDRFGHSQQIKHPYRSGTRRIREIPLYNNSTVPQLVIHRIPRIDDFYRYDPVCYPRPFHHYVALSL
ncbi:unnamed protein product [Adineta ricciae]|uniref:Uncharacterized protein n=1 Tax=Adineta ricciae TaxID=249248 RepID=A0A814CEB0_ADIRI|nr:unnamed protein product [Adineta ricciae]